MGGTHTCAISASGGLQCWGANDTGQLGNGTIVDRSQPTPVTGLGSGVASVAAGLGHTCAVTAAGGLKCWGDNSFGQLGDGTTTQRNAPVNVSGLTSGVAAVSAGAFHTCALTTAGAVRCWGDGFFGQIGNGDDGGETTPQQVTGMTSGIAAISAGFAHTCALSTSGGLRCWGLNAYGQIGDGTDTQRNAPVNVSGLTSGVASVSAGAFHTCALLTAGGTRCWGDNTTGQIGDGTNTQRNSPTPTATGLTPTALGSGGSHTCAVLSDGGVSCWGHNAEGQLGNNSIDDVWSPVTVGPLPAVAAVAVAGGSEHSCALLTGGAIYCWGSNLLGQLGTGEAGNIEVQPVVVAVDTDRDGCTDDREEQSNPATGGLRDANYFWDFMDTPADGNVRDRVITIADIVRTAARFGASGSPLIDPLSAPAPAPAYHTAFDRGGINGPYPWSQAPADGSITVADIVAVVGQFGHTCS